MALHRTRAGVTVIELLVALSILAVMMAMATAGYLQLVHGERRSSHVAMLDMDVRKAIETLRQGLRLTTIDQVVFYPAGSPPYRAVSFPAALDGDGDGMVDLDTGGTNVLWAQTVIYHVLATSPHQLLRTTFHPRNRSLTEAQRAEQLRRVVEQEDHGANYELEPYQRTTRIFSNFFQWELSSQSTSFDGYSPVEERVPVALGGMVLEPGAHTITFRVTDKNSANGTSLYRLALDTLAPTRSGGDLEAEELTVSAATPASSVTTTIPGVCSGNNYLDLPATAVGDSLSLDFHNDLWLESNFRSAGAIHSNTTSEAIGATLDYAVILGGKGDAWTAERRTRVADENATWAVLPYGAGGVLVRVPIEGIDVADAGPLVLSGALRRVPAAESSAEARTAESRCLELSVYNDIWRVIVDSYAVLAETDAAGQIISGTARNIFLQQVSNNKVHGWYVGAGSCEISTEKRYVLSYWLKPGVYIQYLSPFYFAAMWPHPADVAAPYTQVRPQLTNDVALARAALAADWPSGTYTNQNRVVGLERLITSYAPVGAFVSQVYDTASETPDFDDLTWTADTPSGTGLSVWLRSGSASGLDDVSWSAVTSGMAPALESVGRYVQFRARLTSDANASRTPALRQLRLRWAADSAFVNLGGVLYKGSDRGAFEVLVDGRELVRSVRVDLTLFRDVTTFNFKTERLTSSMVAEVEPRNTGK